MGGRERTWCYLGRRQRFRVHPPCCDWQFCQPELLQGQGGGSCLLLQGEGGGSCLGGISSQDIEGHNRWNGMRRCAVNSAQVQTSTKMRGKGSALVVWACMMWWLF